MQVHFIKKLWGLPVPGDCHLTEYVPYTSLAGSIGCRGICLEFQHRAPDGFFPGFPRSITFSMYCGANGTLQAVPPMSTETLPIASATLFYKPGSSYI